MRHNPTTISLAAADDDGIAAAQNPANNADVTLNGALVSGGIAVMDIARRVAITSAGDDTAVTFTIYGTNNRGIAIQESIKGTNTGTAVSTKDYLTVTRIATAGDAVNGLKIGTNGQASTPWFPVNHRFRPFNLGFTVALSSGAVLTYTIEHTEDDVQDLSLIQTGNINVFQHPDIASKSANADGNYGYPMRAIRLTLNSYTSGSATLNYNEAG